MQQRSLRAVAASLAISLVPLTAAAAELPAVPTPDASFESGSLHVDRFGHGDAIVLLPGLTVGTWEWADTIRHLAPAHTVYAVSFPGFDGRPAAAAPLFDRVTGDFWAFLDRQHVARPVLIGHSLGGTLAILLGEQHPERLHAIVAIDGLPVFPGLDTLTAEQRAAAVDKAAATVATETHAQLLEYEQGYMRAAGGVIDPDLAAAAAELSARSEPAAVAQWMREDFSADLRPALPKVTVPLLEIVPYNAPDLASAPFQYTEEQKVQYYRALLAGAPQLAVVSISPARHFVMLDQPQRVFGAIDAFLAQHP